MNKDFIEKIPSVDDFCDSEQVNEAGTLPIDGLPKVARDIIMYYSKTLQCPQDYLTASVFAAISLAIGRHYRISEGDFEEYANLYVALVGDAGAGKSTPINKIFIPMEFIEKKSMEDYEMKLEKEQSKPIDQRNKVHAVEYILRNSTPEATTEALKYNPKGLYQCSDELSSFLTGRGMYNGNFDSGELNTLYDAKCSIKRSRKTDGISYSQNSFFGIIGGIQPNIIIRKFSPDDLINGFLFRFLFVFPDDTRKQYKEIHPNTKTNTPNDWYEFIQNIHYSYYFDKKEQPQTIKFNSEALKLATEFHNEYAVDKYNATRTCSEKSIYAKTTQQLYKLCLIIAVSNGHNTVKKDDVDYAIRCMEYFIHCAFKVQSLFYGNEETKRMSNQEVLRLFCERFEITGKNYKDSDGKEVKVVDSLAKAMNKSTDTVRTMIKRCGFQKMGDAQDDKD